MFEAVRPAINHALGCPRDGGAVDLSGILAIARPRQRRSRPQRAAAQHRLVRRGGADDVSASATAASAHRRARRRSECRRRHHVPSARMPRLAPAILRRRECAGAAVCRRARSAGCGRRVRRRTTPATNSPDWRMTGDKGSAGAGAQVGQMPRLHHRARQAGLAAEQHDER